MTAQKCETGMDAEQHHMCQIAVRQHMGSSPERQSHKQKMARPPDDAGVRRVEPVVSRAREGERVWSRDGQREDKADRPHGDERHKRLPRLSAPERHERRAPRRPDQPDQDAQRQHGIGPREACGSQQYLQQRPQGWAHGKPMRQEEYHISHVQNNESAPEGASQVKLVAGVGFEPTTFRL